MPEDLVIAPLHVVLTAQEMGSCDDPGRYLQHSSGLRRSVAMDRRKGSVHIGYYISELQPDGQLDRCIHAYEKAIYVLAGALDIERDGQQFRLDADGYVLF